MFRVLIDRFIKYCSAGGFATAIHYAIFFTLVNVASWVPWEATLLASSIGAFVAYTLNYQYTFYSTTKHQVILPKFLLVAVAGVFIQTLIVAMLNQHWQLHYFLAQLIATCIGLLLTFLLNNYWTFA